MTRWAVIPANAGIHWWMTLRIPAFAGMTVKLKNSKGRLDYPFFAFSACSSGPMMSSGSGNTMVEFLSAAITVSVSR